MGLPDGIRSARIECAIMLFETTPLTPQGRLSALEDLFASVARRSAPRVEEGHVPLEVLEAYGNFETPLKYTLEAAMGSCRDRERLSRLRKIEKLLRELPDALMLSLTAAPDENWLCLYRKLLLLHELMTGDSSTIEEEGYRVMMQKMVQLAETVARYSTVEINAASMFTLLLMQVEMQRINPPRKRRSKARKKRKTKRSTRQRGGGSASVS